MSNDLISRKALMQSLRNNVLVDVTPNLEQAIVEQHTAYDVDKVVGQLEEMRAKREEQLRTCADNDMADYFRCKMSAIAEVIEIVKAALNEIGDCMGSGFIQRNGGTEMDIKEFAKLINGKEYGYPQFTKEEIETAKENRFVIVYGASDDLMEFEGAIRDEAGCFEGGTAWVSGDRVMESPVFVGDKPIKAIWCGNEKDENGQQITWTYETEIPHETFMIYEYEEPYCRGIVFKIDDVM